MLLGLRRLQKVPDEVRLQKIVEVLDEDRDGIIDASHVLKVPYFTDYRSMGTIGRIAAFRLNFLGNTKIGRSIP
jgi:hypothetical protein